MIPAALTAGVKHPVQRRAQTELAGGQTRYHQKLAGVQLHAMPPAAVEQLGKNRVALPAQRAAIAGVILRLADDALPFGNRMLTTLGREASRESGVSSGKIPCVAVT